VIATQHNDISLLTPEEVADRLKISIRTLQTWRSRGKGPRIVRYGNLVRYRDADLREWIEQHLEDVQRP
jgi:excisionase family DNA binding protein